MQDPRIALINLSSPALLEPGKVLRAVDALKSLKRVGQASWARYKGFTGAYSPISILLNHSTDLNLERMV
jgi:hypothetical protein